MPGLIGDRQDLAIDCTGGGFEGKGDNGDIRGTWGRGRAGGHMHVMGPAAPRHIQDHHVGRADTGIRGPRWLTSRAPRTQPTTCKSGQPLVSTVEMRGNNEGGGGMTGRRGRAARSFTGGGHILISLRAFDRVPRGNPRLMVTPSHCIPLL